METPINFGVSPSNLIMDAQSALDTARIIPREVVSHVREHAIYVVFSAGASAGQVVVESAHDAAYQGTWANVNTVNWAAASRVHLAANTGVHLVLRVRIATAIVGGTVSCYGIGN